MVTTKKMMTTMSVKKMKIYPYPSEVTGLTLATLCKTILNLHTFLKFGKQEYTLEPFQTLLDKPNFFVKFLF